MPNKKRYAVIVAGGQGTRMGGPTPKQYLLLNGRPLLFHTLEQFHAFDPEMSLALCLPPMETEVSFWDELCRKYPLNAPHYLVRGGASRYHSVFNGLNSIGPGAEGLVAIHDGVRPLVTPETIAATFRSAEAYGSGVAAVDLRDSIRELHQGYYRQRSRSDYKLVQTPQTFDLQLIRQAFEQVPFDSELTDDASVFERAGHAVCLVEGNYRNLKITGPEDLAIAEALLRQG